VFMLQRALHGRKQEHCFRYRYRTRCLRESFPSITRLGYYMDGLQPVFYMTHATPLIIDRSCLLWKAFKQTKSYIILFADVLGLSNIHFRSGDDQNALPPTLARIHHQECSLEASYHAQGTHCMKF